MHRIDRIYVSHYPPLGERRAWLESALDSLGWRAEWVTQFDKRTLTAETIAKYYDPNPQLFVERAHLGGEFGTPLDLRGLSTAELANAITHIHILADIARHGYEACLVLEDDILFAPDFRRKLEQYLAELPANWDVLYPGSGCHLHVPAPAEKHHVYPHPRRLSRTADCYVVRGRAAKILSDSMVPFVLPIDWELSYHQWKHQLNVFWGEPSIASQGSENGTYRSSADVGRSLATN